MSTKLRRNRIIEIITTKCVNRQDDLANILIKEGFSVTQATVSRDIKELGIVKIKGSDGKSKYAIPEQNPTHEVSDEKVITLLKTFIVSVEAAKNLVVIKTLSGNGSACGMAIDNLKPEGVVGSIAGDDTLLIVTHDDNDANKVVNYIKEIIKKWLVF